MPATRSLYQRKESRPYPTVEELYKKAQPSYANAGGFIVEEEEGKKSDEEESLEAKFRAAEEKFGCSSSSTVDESEEKFCLDCGRPFMDSYLMKYFDHSVCDECRDLDDKHSLITRTEAKKEFLLKDCDLVSREPTLKFISKKNPHNPRWGDMKLYLRLQVEKRAAELHGSIEAVEETKQEREEKRVEQKRKRFHKKIIELRKTVRSDLYRKPVEIHQHEYGDEEYDSKEDKYFKECTVCSHKDVYEKL